MPEPTLPKAAPAPAEQKKTRGNILKNPRVVIPLGICLLLYIAFNVWIYAGGGKIINKWLVYKTTPTPTPRPIYALPTGTQVYAVSHGKNVTGPKIQKVILDPLTPSPSERQTVTVDIKNDSPITDATAYLLTDKSQQSQPFTLISGTTTNGTWQLSWNIQDTYNYVYVLRFDLRSSTGNYNDSMKIR